jgi:hypothetical protein
MKEKFMIVQNFCEVANWDGFGTHKERCWIEESRGYDYAFEAVDIKNSFMHPEFYIVIKYYE